MKSRSYWQRRRFTYQSWYAMKRRCTDPRTNDFAIYGGRGIQVCTRWAFFEAFLFDMGMRPAGTSIDRIESDGNYEPGNCRWATKVVQRRNMRDLRRVTVDGVTRLLVEWCEIYGVKANTAIQRIRHGWLAERAVTTPVCIVRSSR